MTEVMIATTVALTYGWWATQLRPFAATTAVAVIGAGIAAMAFGSRHERRGSAARLRRRDVAVWVAVLGALAAWQLTAYVQHPRSEHPTLSSLTNALLDGHPARTLAFMLWLAGAARLARR